MSTAEQIYELVKTMPEEQVSEVLNFVEFLQQKSKAQPTQTADGVTEWLQSRLNKGHSAQTFLKIR